MSHNFYPTVSNHRIELLDVLRGFAIIGILLSNILILSGYIFTPFSDLEKMHLPNLNSKLDLMIGILVRGKFYPIFMILFGAGLYMQFRKSSEQGFLKFFGWRMFVLVLIGLMHQTFWAGDVVTVYALFAFLLIPMRKMKAKTYLILASIMFVLHFISYYFLNAYLPTEHPTERIAQLHLPGVGPNELITSVKNDGIAGLWFITKSQLGFLWTIPRYIRVSPSTVFLFMLGAYLLGTGFFVEKAHKPKYYISFLILGVIGTYLMWSYSYSFSIIGNVFLALFYISVIALIMRSTYGQKFLKKLAPLGRMALTNYIMQSIICILIFYGVGLGYFAELPLYMVIFVAILILQFQILFSKYWLKKFKFGPLEGLWRKLTYGKNFNKQ
ncbi:DUF418 domain-containing protein [Marinifilum caeruleilacunae]|uniref:DUF418 domain-containing protein n=1 Tax=Marinifilum caeruleilacunae TaxID=2499076 RepID=A0ABX1WW29_9BACT|nr:DUF418 domain-containing protein [Marinifilum caeruleilacunae]NOU60330.1 DUF418 domain-containing protein [Marinifilum caeruleilacunae]